MGRVASGVRDLRSASDVVGCSVYEEVERGERHEQEDQRG